MDWFLYDNGVRHERVKGLIFYVGISICFYLMYLQKKVDICSIFFQLNKFCNAEVFKQVSIKMNVLQSLFFPWVRET